MKMFPDKNDEYICAIIIVFCVVVLLLASTSIALICIKSLL